MANIVRQSKFRHVFCKPVKHEECMSQITITEITWDAQFCAVNPKFIAIIVKGSGGPFLVLPVNKIGRIDKEVPFVDAHRAPCLDIAFSPFNDNVIASCSEDATAKVWLIPERGVLRTMNEPVVELCGHQKRVNTLAWHPTANNILATAGGENKIFIWNVGTGEALLEISGHPDQIWCISFNYDGSRFVTTCKDKMIRIINSHTGEIINQGPGHEGVKPQRAIFTMDGKILTTGFTKRSERLYALRNPNNVSQIIAQDELDTSNGVLFPLYDEDSGLLYLVGKGDCAIRYYEINDDPPFMHYINTYTTSEPQRGFAFMPKRGIDSVKNEITRIYKVTTKGVVDILQFFVPRKSDLYQTDLYPDTRSIQPSITADEFIAGKDAPPRLVPVNAEAAQIKPKVTVAKKANILDSLQNTEESRPQQHSQQQQPQMTRAPEQRKPYIDDQMGIVPPSQQQTRREPPPPQQKIEEQLPKSQVVLKPREERNSGGGTTAGQQRAAAELNKIRREQNRHGATPNETPIDSRRPSANATEIGGSIADELEKIKAVLRQHERRIRLLEDQLADATMANAYNL